jgi:hypothetical protein
MFRTYPLGTTGPRRPESLRDIIRRVERELAADPERVARRRALLASRPHSLF